MWLAVALLLFAIHVVLFVRFLRCQRWLDWPPATRPSARPATSVTAVVPARNEELDVETCLRSLLAQDYPHLNVIVVDDHSTDRTPEIVDALAARHERLTVVHDPPMRAGWLGKHNALQAGWERVDSELTLFADADIEFAPDCLRTAVAELEARDLSLLSIYPRFEFVSLAETLLLPIYVGGAALLISPVVEDPKSSHAMAVGAFMLLRSDTLRDMNGMEPVRNDILDDVGLARRIKERGEPVGLRAAPDLLRVRFFKGTRHALFGYVKHIIGFVQGWSWLAPVLAFMPLLIYGALIGGVIYGIRQHDLLVLGLSSGSLLLQYVSILWTRHLNRFSPWKALAFPLVCVPFFFSCMAASYFLLAKNSVHWRGRTTALKADEPDAEESTSHGSSRQA